MATEFYFTPELHLKDGRIIRDLDDAASFAREQEVRPGVDQRDEVLHKVERAKSKEEAHAAAHSFLRWLKERAVLNTAGRAIGARRARAGDDRRGDFRPPPARPTNVGR